MSISLKALYHHLTTFLDATVMFIVYDSYFTSIDIFPLVFSAGSVMYEQAMRLALEVPTLGGLQQQAKCYLAAINSLRLVHPNYAWIVKPVPTDTRLVSMEKHVIFLK